MLPTREEALKLIRDGLLFNPGPWGKHCLTAAHCAEKIASACGDMDVEKAYILGLLHDIGRKFGVRHLGHVYDGYVYMKSLGYDEVAKICLTHSFNNHTIDEYIGKFDVTDEELIIIKTELAKTIYDEYDRLIQLCDCLAGAEGVLDIETLKREFEEELHAKIEVDNLLAIGEIYFPWGKRPCHQICLYYNVHLMDDNIPLDGVFHGYDELDNERIDLDFCWVSLEDLKKGTKVYPLELIPYILEPGKEIVHFVSKQI